VFDGSDPQVKTESSLATDVIEGASYFALHPKSALRGGKSSWIKECTIVFILVQIFSGVSTRPRKRLKGGAKGVHFRTIFMHQAMIDFQSLQALIPIPTNPAFGTRNEKAA
jgi:hypothetical protein